MQRNTTPSSVWHRRTNRMIAAAVIVIGLTMMISNITQCIYIGMLFIILALIWLAWLTMKERKLEPPRPEDQPSPVLFLVTSHMLPRLNRPTAANPSDKPPSYDQILTLDGLPPEYSSVMPEKPPRYEDLGSQLSASQPGTSSKSSTLSNTSGKSVESDSLRVAQGGGENIPSTVSHTDETTSRGPSSSGSSTSLKRQMPRFPNIRGKKRHNSSGATGASKIQSNSEEVVVASVHSSAASTVNRQTNNQLKLHVSTLQQDTAGDSSSYLPRYEDINLEGIVIEPKESLEDGTIKINVNQPDLSSSSTVGDDLRNQEGTSRLTTIEASALRCTPV